MSARTRWPAALLLVAFLGAILHIAPVWYAQWQTPPGWTFTGVTSGSPDVMQYRILMRRSQTTGPIVDNTLTTEPNSPYIPTFFYYSIGAIASSLGTSDSFVLNYVGMALAFLLILFLFSIVDYFLEIRYQTWWVFLVILLGGGLGAHLILISQIGFLNQTFVVQRIVVEGLQNAIVFDQYRNHYVFSTLFDTHFSFVLIVALCAVGGFYSALKAFSYLRAILAAFLFAAATVLHIYDGITLLAIGAGVVFLLWRKQLPLRPPLVTFGACALATAAAILWQLHLVNSGGLSLPPWRADSVYAAELILAYPIGWGLMAWGLGEYWQRAGFKETFLLGWVLGCVGLTLSGPFYPYPDRGTLTLQIPVYIVAGSIFFASKLRVRAVAGLVVVGVLVATPGYVLYKSWRVTHFARYPSGDAPPHIWMSPDHLQLVETLKSRASEDDALVVDKREVAWQTDDLWLAPAFPGKLYAGQYFLTVDYERKREEVNRFFAVEDPDKRAEFLNQAGIRFVYVDTSRQDPAPFLEVPHLVPLVETSAGAVFEYRFDH